MLDQHGIEIFTTKGSVSVGRLDLKDTVLDLENRDIERTTAQIVDSDHTVTILVQTVGQSGSSGLVDHTENLQTSNLSGILGSLTLRIVEVSGDSDDSM